MSNLLICISSNARVSGWWGSSEAEVAVRELLDFCVVSVWLFKLPQPAAIRLQSPNCISSNVVTRQKIRMCRQGLGAKGVLVGVIACGITPFFPSCIASLIPRLEKTTGQLSASIGWNRKVDSSQVREESFPRLQRAGDTAWTLSRERRVAVPLLLLSLLYSPSLVHLNTVP